MNRISREKTVVSQMIAIYCRSCHKTKDGGLCDECRALRDYAHRRLDRCPKGDSKSSCRKCDIHCYSPEKRNQIREVMRQVGPRMIFIHPISAIRHLLSELR